ncbi:MAG: peptidase C39 family protein [Candidatus Limnocylindria bacterium]
MGASIDFHQLPLSQATHHATAERDGGVVLTGGTSGTWTSEWREPGFAFTRLVPSWNAETPDGTWIAVEAQGRRATGGDTAWYSFGQWAFGDATLRRASIDGQRDGDARVETDTVIAAVPLEAYRIRVTLARGAGSAETPVVRLVAAVVSDDAAVRAAPQSAHDGTVHDLSVPSYSQEIHRGEYPEYDGGGEAWCSPTSTTMVLGHWNRGPTSADVTWVDPSYQDPGVDHAARFTYDATYGGTGNWTFNAAYAAAYGMRAFVTQLRSLAEAERFVAAGIPLVASINAPPGGLPGFLYEQGTNGHLLVIRGFTASGDVIANDPAAWSNSEVRRVYPREAFERNWVGGSGGIVYVIHPPDHPLPAHVEGATANW